MTYIHTYTWLSCIYVVCIYLKLYLCVYTFIVCYLHLHPPGKNCSKNRLFVSKNENKTVVQELVQEFLASSPLAVLLQRGSPVLLE